MGNKLKRPDNVTDLPASTPYPTNVGAPAFSINDMVQFKDTRSTTAIHHLDARLQEVKKQYNELIDLAQDTELVYSAHYNFIPIVGKVYHLYANERHNFLSIISPEQWSTMVADYLGSFKFTPDNVWERQQ